MPQYDISELPPQVLSKMNGYDYVNYQQSGRVPPHLQQYMPTEKAAKTSDDYDAILKKRAQETADAVGLPMASSEPQQKEVKQPSVAPKVEPEKEKKEASSERVVDADLKVDGTPRQKSKRGRPLGRPTKANAKLAPLRIRFDETEHEAVTKNAKAAGLTVSAYLRHRALGEDAYLARRIVFETFKQEQSAASREAIFEGIKGLQEHTEKIRRIGYILHRDAFKESPELEKEVRIAAWHIERSNELLQQIIEIAMLPDDLSAEKFFGSYSVTQKKEGE